MSKGQPLGYELPECESCVALHQQLTDVTAHLEAQRTATYQAVAREHAAKQQLATVTAEREHAKRQLSKEAEARYKAEQQLAQVTQERDEARIRGGEYLTAKNQAEQQLAAMTAERDELWQECEQEHRDILVCTECGRTSKHRWIGVVYESTPDSAEEYDTKCNECGSMSLDEDARSVVNELDTCKAQLAEVTQERDEALKKARWKHTHDDSLELELQRQLATSQARCAQYDELIMAVASKYPNETRHQTALRYIQERESRPCSGPAQAATPERPPA